MKRISIVIPTHNRKDYLAVLLNQVIHENLPEEIAYNVIVVVDGSTDGTSQMLGKEFPNVHIVQGNGNLWYTKSMNAGFKYALEYLNPDLFLTMNDDTEVGENFIKNMLEGYHKATQPSIIGAMSVTLQKPERVVTSGSYLSNKLLGKVKHYIPMFTEVSDCHIENQLKASHILPGRGMLIPKSALTDVGLFDEKFRQYHSDIDFCLRAKKKGFNVYTYWGAKVYVHHEMTGKGTSFKKESFPSFVKNFFNDTSRLYLPAMSRYKWRHSPKILWPVNMVLFIGVSIRNHFFRRKL